MRPRKILKTSRKKQHSGIDKVIFWQAVEIVLEAAINHAHRYAELAEVWRSKKRIRQGATN